jgi:hypothetical protein
LTGNNQGFAGARVKPWNFYLLLVASVFRAIGWKISLLSVEDRHALQWRSFSVRFGCGCDARNQEVVGLAATKHFDSHERGSNHKRMDTVDPDPIERVEPREALALVTAECHVPSQGLDRPARFNAPDHIALCELLVLEAHGRLSEDPRLRQPP